MDAKVPKVLWTHVLHHHDSAPAAGCRRQPASGSAANTTGEHRGRADCIECKFHRRVIVLPGRFLALLDFGFFPYANDSLIGIDRPIATGSAR
jgi:hypothetical protein